MSEIGTLTGEDPAERVEMALGKPLLVGNKALKGPYRRGKAQNHTIIALYNRLPVIPTEQVIITPCTYSPDRPIILNKLPEALVEGDWPAVKHASGISSKRRVSCLGN